MYSTELPLDQADVMMTALIRLSRPRMPALLVATTQGEAAAPSPPLVRRASLDGQMRPMARAPRE